MIIFLYGQDTYRSRQKLNEIIDHYQKSQKGGLNLKYYDFKKDNYEVLRDEIQSVSLFTGKKLIVLKNAFLNENFKINFLKDARKFLDSNDLILFYEEIDISEKEKLFKFLKKHGKSQEFKPLDERSLKNWVKKEFEKEKIKIEPQASNQLINYVGSDLWQISGEIKKLTTYKIGERTPIIKLEDVNLLVRPKIELDIFKTIDAIATKNKKQALSLLHQHLEKGDNPLYLLSMINFQFRNLLVVKSDRSGYKKLKMHPYIVRKTIQQAKKFSFGGLKNIYQKIFQTDLAIKTGKIDPITALDILVAEI